MSRTQPKENCGRCVYYDPPSEQCRVGSPHLGVGGGAAWPVVATTEWCGRFRECPEFALNREDRSNALKD